MTLQARKQQLVRDAIWDGAVNLFSEKGFDETTVDDIAQASGVSRRSFFRYFSSKNDLMAHGVVNYGTSLADAIRACPRTSRSRQCSAKQYVRSRNNQPPVLAHVRSCELRRNTLMPGRHNWRNWLKYRSNSPKRSPNGLAKAALVIQGRIYWLA